MFFFINIFILNAKLLNIRTKWKINNTPILCLRIHFSFFVGDRIFPCVN